MAISAEWDIDFTNLVISHIDGTLDYDAYADDASLPVAGDYVKGGTSGAVG